ncbi:hypothetical protein ACN4EE_17595 [Geminocystis sp. CENA526]|uniref:hypothetical protein n=1 Tax=Geminocystis sp. CENA526 TaxID=1355871 RepID=UPI003D6E66C3
MTKIILDPTNLYPIEPNYTIISNEVEWLKYFTLKDEAYWIKNKIPCAWTKEWLKVWNKIDLIIEIKENPRPLLASILNPLSIPAQWNNEQILNILTQLNRYPDDTKISHLLAEISDTELKLWECITPSKTHLAQWLCVAIPEEYQVFEQVWLEKFIVNNHNDKLRQYYQINNKLNILKDWVGIGLNKIDDLEIYPLPLPVILEKEFINFWRRKISKTQGEIIDNLILSQEYQKKLIAKIAYNIFLEKTNWITPDRVAKISIYLHADKRQKLNQLIPPPQPKSLNIDAKPDDCLQWVTNHYLPFRLWEINDNMSKNNKEKHQISSNLADSFVHWIVKNYPELKLDNVEKSWLNYSVTPQVEKLAKNNPILWVIVDGLGWLDHRELILKLTQKKSLYIQQDIQPKFSILPTKTEYAKWSLFTQLLPNHNSWNNNAGDGFSFINNGYRYTDRNKAKLIEDLQQKKYQIYCWDTTQLDELYHHETDWQTLYQLEREKVLDGIVKDILHFLEQYPEPEKLQIIIASDHGQIIGEVDKINNYPNNLKPQGRMAIGTTDDSRFVVLSAQKFDLPYDISVVKNQDSLGSFNYTQNQKIIGNHGGLFPEEVVVGFSILSQNISRLPVWITCKGEGKAKDKGELEIIIDNPNRVSLTNLCLYVNEIEELKMGKILNVVISPNQKINHKLEINKYPELPPDNDNNSFTLSGKITFNFANAELGEAELDSQSLLTIQQIFTSGFTGGLDEFF